MEALSDWVVVCVLLIPGVVLWVAKPPWRVGRSIEERRRRGL